MENQDYESYMRGILGYRNDYNNIYNNSYSNFDEDRLYQDFYNQSNVSLYNNIEPEDINNMYPEIYKITYPIVCKLCTQNQNKKLTNELIDNMVNEICSVIEPEDNKEQTQAKQLPPLRNGDVRNPNAKEVEEKKETRNRNFLLQDLIKILILKEFTNMNRPYRPQPPRPPMPPFYNQQFRDFYGRPF